MVSLAYDPMDNASSGYYYLRYLGSLHCLVFRGNALALGPSARVITCILIGAMLPRLANQRCHNLDYDLEEQRTLDFGDVDLQVRTIVRLCACSKTYIKVWSHLQLQKFTYSTLHSKSEPATQHSHYCLSVCKPSYLIPSIINPPTQSSNFQQSSTMATEVTKATSNCCGKAAGGECVCGKSSPCPKTASNTLEIIIILAPFLSTQQLTAMSPQPNKPSALAASNQLSVAPATRLPPKMLSLAIAANAVLDLLAPVPVSEPMLDPRTPTRSTSQPRTRTKEHIPYTWTALVHMDGVGCEGHR
jgi:hypothetical protein